jgi:hypothetical protein
MLFNKIIFCSQIPQENAKMTNTFFPIVKFFLFLKKSLKCFFLIPNFSRKIQKSQHKLREKGEILMRHLFSTFM